MKVGGRLAPGDPRLDQRVEALALAPKKLHVKKRIKRVDRKVQAFKDHEGGFVERGRHAMAKGETGRPESPDGVAQPIARRRKELEALVGFAQSHPQEIETAETSGPVFAVAHEVLARFAVQVLGVSLLRAFDRPCRTGAGVLPLRRHAA